MSLPSQNAIKHITGGNFNDISEIVVHCWTLLVDI